MSVLLGVSPIIQVHIVAALVAVALGMTMLVLRKGTRRHRWIGRSWAAVMLTVAIGSFWITGVGEFGHWSWIHLLSIWTLIALAIGIWAARTRRVRTHRMFMIGLYLGLIGAGAGAFVPGRLMSQVLGYG